MTEWQEHPAEGGRFWRGGGDFFWHFEWASIKFMSGKHYVYPSPPPFALHGQSPMHPSHLHEAPRCFCDNMNGVKFVHCSVDVLQETFEGVYHLDVQQEGDGSQFITLQGDHPENYMVHASRSMFLPILSLSLPIVNATTSFCVLHHHAVLSLF